MPLCYLLLAMLFYAPLLLGTHTFPRGDFTDHFLPFSHFQQAAIRAGQLPLWNPHTYSGHPFLADTQAAVFYPLSNLLLLLTLPWAGPDVRLYWLQVEALLHIALGGWFTYLLVRDLSDSRWGGFVAGICFAFSGYLTGYPPLQLAVLRTAIWVPLLLWLFYRALQQPERWRWWIGAALGCATMFMAGHPQTFLHGSYFLGIWLIWLYAGKWRATSTPPRQLGQPLVALLFCLLLALALSAAQLLPSLEFTQYSVRANVDYDFVSGGLPLQDTWQLLLPRVLTHFSPLYIGIIGLGLALVGLFAPQPLGRDRSMRGCLALLFLLFLLLAHGQNGPLYPLFYRFAPGWQLFRGQERAALGVALSLSILAGLGTAALPQLPHLFRRRLALLFAVLVAGGVYGFGVLWQLLGQTAVNEWQYLLIAIATILLALVLVVVLALPGWARRRYWLLGGAILLNLFAVNMTTNLSAGGPATKTALTPAMVAVQAAVGEQRPRGTLAGRVYNEFRLYEDYAMQLDVEDVWGSSPLRLARYATLFAAFPLDRMWQLTAVETVLTWRRELFGPSTLLGEFPQSTDSTYLHTLPPDWVHSRAWFVTEARVADDATALAMLADHAVDLGQIALLPPTHLSQSFVHAPGDRAVAVARISPRALQLTVHSEAGGLLVISENWLPGWHVADRRCLSAPAQPCVRTTSADPLPLLTPLRTNLTFIGLAVPPGELRFTLHYWPTSVTMGLVISGSTLLLILLIALWRGRRWLQLGRTAQP